MRYLIDTHVILWWLNDSESLNDKLKTVVKNPDNLIYISTASLWEINIKVNIGKLIIDENYADIIVDQGFKLIDIKLEHAMELLKIPQIHKDPFDRILVAQTIVEGCKLITYDRQIIKYQIETIQF